MKYNLSQQETKDIKKALKLACEYVQDVINHRKIYFPNVESKSFERSIKRFEKLNRKFIT